MICEPFLLPAGVLSVSLITGLDQAVLVRCRTCRGRGISAYWVVFLHTQCLGPWLPQGKCSVSSGGNGGGALRTPGRDGAGGHSQEEVLHDVVVVGGAAVREEAGSKHDDGVETFAVVPWGQVASEQREP